MSNIPVAELPLAIPTPPIRALPEGAVDCHVHPVGHDAAYPLWENRVEDPGEGSLSDWLARFETHQNTLGFDRAIMVHSILYGGDNTITLDATRQMGFDRAKAICLLPDGASEAELDRLAHAGTIGIRLNYVHGGILSWDGAKAMAPALAERGMHIQMLAHTHLHLEEIADDVRALPVPVVFDHIGWPDLSLGSNNPGFQTLCRLLADGHAWVKLSGAYRVCDHPYTMADDHVSALLSTNPERCLWGTDWPHLMLADAKLPDAGVLLNRFLDLADDTTAKQVLCTTPNALYGFAQPS